MDTGGAANDRLTFKKVLGKDDPADLYENTSGHHIETLAYRFRDGRAEEAPQLHVLRQSRHE